MEIDPAGGYDEALGINLVQTCAPCNGSAVSGRAGRSRPPAAEAGAGARERAQEAERGQLAAAAAAEEHDDCDGGDFKCDDEEANRSSNSSSQCAGEGNLTRLMDSIISTKGTILTAAADNADGGDCVAIDSDVREEWLAPATVRHEPSANDGVVLWHGAGKRKVLSK